MNDEDKKQPKITISRNFWTELEARGFLDRKDNGGTSKLDFAGAITKGASGDYQIINLGSQSIMSFVNAEVFLKALRMTEEKVKYRLFM